jgi:mannan endo-1,4-beta-mannosidase
MNRIAISGRLILATFVIVSCSPVAPPTSRETTSPSPMTASTIATDFVTVSDGKFMLNGRPYYFVGANFWQAMNLGVDGPRGNRELLLKELDHLQRIGVANLRVMAASEGPNTEPYRMVPALMVSPGVYDEEVLDGLDFMLAEIGKREMKAVMVLNNYWQWSGGMGQYVSWSEGSQIPYPGDWGEFMEYVARFYDCRECQQWYRRHIEVIVTRLNPYTGLMYRDDPAIFAWELANEPRRYPYSWIDQTAAYIKSLDPNHLVTTGSEGTPPGERQDFQRTHGGSHIDYATIHIWPQNWGWYDPESPTSYERAEKNALEYLNRHVFDAAVLQKPLVLEEFGLARDFAPLEDIYDPRSSTAYRDRFYKALFDEVSRMIQKGGPLVGSNFWAWGGASRPGDDWLGDPPHEPPGWYSVYDQDESTIAIISSHAMEIATVVTP